MELLTHSRQRVFRECQRKHSYMYTLGVRPVAVPHALRFGSLIHAGLEAWAKGGKDLDAAIAAVQVEAEPFDLARAEALLAGYHARWLDETFQYVAIEAAFEAPLVNPETGHPSRLWKLAGKIDAVIMDGGRLRIMEHKTSSEDLSPGSSYWQRLRMDGQVSVYFDGARALGYEVEDCLYDVIGKPLLRPKVNETPVEFRTRLCEAIIAEPARYYGRAPVVRLEKELDEARWDTWRTAAAMRESERTGHAPRNPDACVRFRGQVCQYFSVCSGESALNDPGFRVVEHKHPELERGA